MMRSVEPSTPLQPTLAYIAPSVDVLCEAQVHHELLAIEDLGWRVVPLALAPGERSPRAAFSFAQDCTVIRDPSPLRGWASGLLAALQLRSATLGSLRSLLSDMAQLGWARPRSWVMLRHWLTAARVAHHLRERRCTHVHAHGASRPAQVAMYAAAMCDIAFTCTAYDRDLFQHSLLLREVAQRSRCLITSSHYNKQWLADNGVAPQRIAVVRCSPRGQAEPRPAPFELAPVRQRPRTGAFRIGMLCPLIDRSGVDDVLQALALLIRRGCAPVKLLVAGQGPERLRLQVQADRLGIHACVEFAGDLSPQATGTWLRTLDLFVAASKPDRFGVVDDIPPTLVEAMAAGVPVIATQVSGIPELVVEDRTGFLATPGQPATLAEQIDYAMAHPDVARARAQAGRAHVRWEFGREQNLRRLVSHFGTSSQTEDTSQSLEQAA